MVQMEVRPCLTENELDEIDKRCGLLLTRAANA